MSLLKTHLLQYFVVLAEELHFGRAAERLSITQPPLSSALKALEEELATRLVERDSKHVRLTPAGTAFYGEARQILERLVRAAETTRAVAGGMRGRLDIGITGSMIYRGAPRIVHAYSARMPDIEITLRELSSAEQIDLLLNGQLHVGFVNTPTVPPGLAIHPLRRDFMVCCLPANHALAGKKSVDLASLADEPFIMQSRETAPANYDNVIAIFSRAGIHPRTRHATRQWLTTVALVSEGFGVALVPSSIAKAGIAGVRFVPLKGEAGVSVGGIVWNASTRLAALDAFIDTARAFKGGED